MKKNLRFTLLFFALLQTANLAAQERYTLKSGDPNGIGKWYMGRQIAQVMSHFGIGWLEREEREKEENTSLLLKNLSIQPGIVIADIGAGSGYHSTLLSKMVGSGKVYAVDVEREMIAYLHDRIKLEMMLLVDVYHEFSFPYEMALSMLEALKPDGKLVLVEFRAEDPKVPIKTIHKMSEQQAVKEFKAAGFLFEKNIGNLPWQHCLIFRKPGN
jgi:SAM-dependent methyltransferase